MATISHRKSLDPYQELETYLKEAQEEIGRTFDEVREKSSKGSSNSNGDGLWQISTNNVRVDELKSSSPGKFHEIVKSQTISEVPSFSTDRHDFGTNYSKSKGILPKNQSVKSSDDPQNLTRLNGCDPILRKKVQRSHSDMTANSPAILSWKAKVNQENDEHKRLMFARPPSVIEDDIDILKSWADYFAQQVNDAFSSLESLNDDQDEYNSYPSSKRISCSLQNSDHTSNGKNGKVFSSDNLQQEIVPNGAHNHKKCVTRATLDDASSSNKINPKIGKNSDAENKCEQLEGNHESTNSISLNSSNQFVDDFISLDSNRKRMLSSSSSSSSQVRPEEVVSFMKRIEASIRSSTEHDPYDSNNDSVFMDDAMTQTSPCASRSSSVNSLPVPKMSQINPTTHLDVASSSSSSVSSMGNTNRDSSSLSCLSNAENLSTDDKISCSSTSDIDAEQSSLSLSKCSSDCNSFESSVSASSKTSDDFNNNCDVDKDCLDACNCSHSNLHGTTCQCENFDNGALKKDEIICSVCTHHFCDARKFSTLSSPSDAKCGLVAAHPSVLNLKKDFSFPSKSQSVPSLGNKSENHGLFPMNSSFQEENCKSTSSETQEINTKTFPIYIKAQTRKHLAELEAVESCTWLRAAGFPQYAQMYEENQFPVNISAVQKDHYFLDQDAIQSLFRRLNTLNRCAKMKISNLPRQNADIDSEDEDLCALSENWMFLKSNRRWSRVNQDENELIIEKKETKSVSPSRKSLNVPSAVEAHSSFDSVLTADDYISSPPSNINLASRIHHSSQPRSSSAQQNEMDVGDSPLLAKSTQSVSADRSMSVDQCGQFQRTGSERFKDGAKALLRRMESFKSRRRKRNNTLGNRDAVVIDDSFNVNANTVDPSALKQNRLKPPELVLGNDGSNLTESCNLLDELSISGHSKKNSGRRFFGGSLKKYEDALSDSECSSATSPSVFPSYIVPDTNSGNTSLLEQYWKSSRLSPVSPKRKSPIKNGTPESTNSSPRERVSVYDNVPVVFFNQDFPDFKDDLIDSNELRSYSEDADKSQINSLNNDSINENESCRDDSLSSSRERRDSGVGLSLSRSVSTKRQSKIPGFIPLDHLSSGPLMVLRKLALLKLTALMERYSPSNRSGWNWAMPKFIKKIKAPDYKDKTVFGLPLMLVLRRTGQPLPSCIYSAINYLKKTAIESVGLFRKSGVRSRIQHLKNLTENHQDKVNFDNHQAYDVADLLKQYFRDLPEALLTNKLSETFISIFQYIPNEMRFEAMQSAIILMPDENREVLQILLTFLHEVSQKSDENQMNASNLAVCFAPSLFHTSMPRSSSNSPRRRKTVGAPDQKELKENRAAHECLTQMIIECSKLFSVPEEVLNQCRYSYLENSNLITLDDLTKTPMELTTNWERYVDNCIQNLVKDTRSDKYLTNSKGWVPVSYPDAAIDLAFKKVGDGHPLRLWRTSTEVEAPPVEVLNKILRERHIWDRNLLNWRIINKLDRNTEIYQYVINSMNPHPSCDFCVIRTWRTDLTRGSCILIETSIDHPDVQTPADGIRGVMLTSRYLLEPCGSGKSRISHISRIDMRGKSPEWYNRAYGHMTTIQLIKLRDSFKHGAEGPETKV